MRLFYHAPVTNCSQSQKHECPAAALNFPITFGTSVIVKDFKKEFRETEDEAIRGYVPAMEKLGCLYAMGVPHAPVQDFDQAERWSLKAQATFERAAHILGCPLHNPASETMAMTYIAKDGSHFSIVSGDPNLAE